MYTPAFVIISGCSGGGKSTLLAELQRRGHRVIEEPGRRVVQEQMASGGQALPWRDMRAFLERVIEVAQADHAQARRHEGSSIFFDRSLIDAAAALQALTGEEVLQRLGRSHRYHPQVFLTPPWPDIYVQDAERRHDIEAAIAEYERLLHSYPAQGYQVCVLERCSVAQRADFVLDTLAGGPMPQSAPSGLPYAS
ncbi:AAA family ATPase [Bordetella trematum]|uniref:AAA family ATPase n=1 Tax=Bordetella trematum TaxID=123899 RepID=UPI0006923415|nr:AAA family ATPase [Bordetella trematum]